MDACVQIGQFTHTVGQYVVFVVGGGEDAGIGPELLACAAQVGLSYNVHAGDGFAAGIFLTIDFPVAEHLGHHLCAQCVHTGNAHTVQTTAHFVASLVKLASGMQDRHDHLQSTLVLLLVHVNRDASSVVLDGDALVGIDGDLNMRAVAGQGLVDGVVHRLVDKVVETLLADVTNVHGRTLAHSFKPFQYLNIGSAVLRTTCLCFFHYNNSLKFGYKFTKKNRDMKVYCKKKRRTLLKEYALCFVRYGKSVFYPSFWIYIASFDLRLEALFLWMMLVLASLSRAFCTLGYKASASFLSVVARSLRTALRMVFA